MSLCHGKNNQSKFEVVHATVKHAAPDLISSLVDIVSPTLPNAGVGSLSQREIHDAKHTVEVLASRNIDYNQKRPGGTFILLPRSAN